MKKALAILLLLCLLAGCGQTPPPARAADELTAAVQYDLTAFELDAGLTPTGQACLSGENLYFLASAPQAEETPEYGGLETRLYRVELAAGKTARLAVYRSDAEDNAESYTSVAALFPAENGGVWVMENTTHYIFDLPGDFDETLQNKWEYYQYRGNSTVLRCLTPDGAEETSFTMTNLQSSLTTAAYAGGYILCAQGENILALTQEGAVQTTVTAPAWVSALAVRDDSSLWVMTDHDESGQGLYCLSLTDFSLTQTGILPTALYSVCGTQAGTLYFAERGNLFAWDTARGTGKKYLDWQDYGRDRSAVAGLLVTENGGLAALYQQDAGEKLELLCLTPSEREAPEYDITLGVLYPDDSTMDLVLDFNAKNNGGKVRVMDYSEYEALGQNGVDQLRLDLAAGEGPDLLFSADWNENIADLAACQLEDLSPYLQKDEGLMNQGLMTSVINALRDRDGRLYTIASGFLLSTAIGRADVVSPTPMTVSRVNLLCQSVENDGFSPMEPYTTRTDAMQGHLQRHYSAYFVDGSCDLEQDAFYEGLNFVRQYPQTLDWSGYENGGISEDWLRVRLGHQLYLSGTYMSFQALAQDMSAVGENAVLCGWPDTPGGHALEVWESWGMTTSCRDKALGWRFLRQVLTEEYQTSRPLMSLPTNRSAFRRLGQSAMQSGSAGYYPVGDEMVEISTRLTQKQYNAIVQAVDSATVLSRPVNGVLAQAVCQAASEYFTGDMAADDAARAAQFAALAVLKPDTAMVPQPEETEE